LKKLLQTQAAAAYALFPIPYLLLQRFCFFAADAMLLYLEWDGLLWQCTSALGFTMFSLAPLIFTCTGIASITHSVKKLRIREGIRKHVILISIALATIAASAAYFWWYWYA